MTCSAADGSCRGRIEQHHDDYASDETRPLCRRHHALWHKEHGHAPNYTARWLSVKIRREVYESIAALAESDGRSASNMLEIIVRAGCLEEANAQRSLSTALSRSKRAAA